MHDHSSHHHEHVAEMPRETEGLPEARTTEVVELGDGDEFRLEIVSVKKRIGDATVRMLTYNGSVPGPTLKVPQGATITVPVTNHGDIEATVHWHGLRLENRYDGTHDTQAPIPVGETYTYQVHVPDPGAYWYHPHIREDYGQELGLYGNILVTPNKTDYWPPANRELLLTLDDILIEEGRIAAFRKEETTHVAMGRFGNVMLVGGEPDLQLEAKRGEVIRFYFTDTANTRVFNVMLPGAQMKLVGADAGHYEREELVEEVLLAPSERVVIDVLFPEPGELELQHRTPERTYRLASITVADEQVQPSYADGFTALRRTGHGRATRKDRAVPRARARQDAFVRCRDGHGRAGRRRGHLRMPDARGSGQRRARQLPEVRDEAARPGGRGDHVRLSHASGGHQRQARPVPEVRHEAPAGGGRRGGAGHGHEHHHGHHEHEGHGHGHHGSHEGDGEHGHHGHHHAEHEHAQDAAQGIEWEDDMVEVNRMTTPANMRWKLVDRDTGAENAQIDWTFRSATR